MIFVYKTLTLKKATPFFEQLHSKDGDPLKFGRRFTPPSPPAPHPPPHPPITISFCKNLFSCIKYFPLLI